MAEDREQSELNDAEREILARWGGTTRAPASLRAATLEAARRRGLVGGRMNALSFGTVVGWAAAVAVGAALGFGAGRQQATKAEPASTTTAPATKAAEPAGEKFALLLYENAQYQVAPSDGVLSERVKEYVDWSRGVAKGGRYVSGNKLADGGKYCRLEAGHLAVEDLAFDGKRGLLAGYFLIGAANLDEAISIARGCPHFKYGGTVEVRRIDH